MNWRLASRLSVITMALLVIVLVLILQSRPNPGGLFAASGSGTHSSQLQGTDLGGTPAPDFRLVDQFGKAISLSQLQGKPVVLTFLYTHCKDVCPLTAEKLHTTMQDLGSDATRVAVVAVSTDPKGDTPAAALAFSQAHRMLNYWHFLRGTQAQLSAVWSNYSIYATPEGNNSVQHSFGVYVIDKHGDERIFLDHDFTPAQLAGDLQLLLHE